MNTTGAAFTYSQYMRLVRLHEIYQQTQGDVFSAPELARLRYWRWAYRYRLTPLGLDGVDSIAGPIAVG